MYTLCLDFAKRFPNVEKTEYFPSADSVRIYGTAHIFNDDPPYTAEIIPNTAFRHSYEGFWNRDDRWDRYDSYMVILHHGDRCRTGQFSSGKEFERLIQDLFDTNDPEGYFLSNSNIDEYHERAEQFFSSLVHQLEDRKELDIVNIDYLLKTVSVAFKNQKCMWELSVSTRKKTLPVPEARHEFSPYIYAVEMDNPAYAHYSQLYSVYTADNVEDFIDQIINPKEEKWLSHDEILAVLNNDDKTEEET